jgi:hypothetical protein
METSFDGFSSILIDGAAGGADVTGATTIIQKHKINEHSAFSSLNVVNT